ncbi:integrase catalytic domain-containing protein [Trichonephila clavipes]|nr:integrase catalytic domain-containing protein [Trichonephila clavipes]
MDADKIKNKRKALKSSATKFVNNLNTILVNETNVHSLEIVYNQLIEKIECLKISDNELLSVIDVKDIEKEVEHQFENAIGKNSSLSKIENLIYLQSLVGGVAAKAISDFALTESNYDAALELLKTRFGQKNLLINAHLGSLLNITPIENTSDTNSLRKLYDRAETEIRNLESLGINSESYCNLLALILLKVLPSDLILEFSRKNKSDNWDLKALLGFLVEEIQSREKAQSFHLSVGEKQNSNNSKQECNSFAFGSRSNNRNACVKEKDNNSSEANQSTANSQCIFCGENLHDSSSCDSIKLLPWLARSPDLSPIENMWFMVAQRLTQITPAVATPDQFWQRVEAAWSAVPQERIQSLFESIPRRVAAVISNNGGYSGN